MGTGDEPAWNVVQRLRLSADDIDAVRAQVHELLRERGRTACSWEIGSSATPPDLVRRLKARGLVADDDPHILAMVLQAAPAAVPGIEAGPVRDFAEFLAAARLAWTSFGMERGVDEDAERLRYEAQIGLGHGRTFVARLDGEIVGSGTSTYVEGAVTLNGGAVLPQARGRGAYRALVRARWEDAVARGTPTLVTQAGRMSAPILERLGFRRVARIHILLDRFG
jgi:GNAT superfamily N-acetyltransferase